MIRVYAVRLSEAMRVGEEAWHVSVSPDRSEKAKRYRSPQDRVRCLVGGALLTYACRQAGKTEEWVTVAVNAYGKPYVLSDPDFHYSLSHSGDWVLLAWDHHPVGVDVEVMEEGRDLSSLADRYFSVEERVYMEREPMARFYFLWTAKESYLKYRGTGFACGLRTPDLTEDGAVDDDGKRVYLHRLVLTDRHCLSLCGESSGWSVSWLKVQDLVRLR